MRIVQYLYTIKDLGFSSVLKVVIYKISIKFRINRVFFIKANLGGEPVYLPPAKVNSDLPAVESWKNREIKNSFLTIKIQERPPNWFYNPISNKYATGNNKLWADIKDFDPALGDIKGIWELSRFDWIIPLSQQASKGDEEAFSFLNKWLTDWKVNNQPYYGVNWKCGQETSIRVLHLITGAYLLGQSEAPSSALIHLVTVHLKRIEPTISYAIGQNNNHATSEAAALYVGGAFLLKNGHKRGYRFYKKGERIITERMSKLIGDCGTFSQYSLNYHRLMLDAVCCCEFFRIKFDLPPLPAIFYKKASLATNWLFSIVDGVSGDGPNVGANDGAKIIPLTNCGYRDFRPTVQLAMALFNSARAYSPGKWDDQFEWLKLKMPVQKSDLPASLIADDGGFALLRMKDTFVCLRYPRFRFRPSQNDILHLDLWINGENILRDGGSYSYNADSALMNYFGSVSAHNTIQFGQREPMQKISRFLYGKWVKTDWVSTFKETDSSVSYGAGYTDHTGASHKRKINLSESQLEVIDEIMKFDGTAFLRWRLIEDDWVLSEENDCELELRSTNRGSRIKIVCSEKIISCKLVKGFESLYYMQSNSTQVLEIAVQKECSLQTLVFW